MILKAVHKRLDVYNVLTTEVVLYFKIKPYLIELVMFQVMLTLNYANAMRSKLCNRMGLSVKLQTGKDKNHKGG